MIVLRKALLAVSLYVSDSENGKSVTTWSKASSKFCRKTSFFTKEKFYAGIKLLF